MSTIIIANTNMSIASLSNPLLLHIFELLPLASWIPLQLTCHRFYNLTANNQALLKTWCFNMFPSYLNASTPLPPNTDYKWLSKCLSNSIDDNPRTYGYTCTTDMLWIRSVISYEPDLVELGILLDIPSMTYDSGTFINDELQGQGTRITDDYTYAGEFIDNVAYGLGTYTHASGDTYHGYFVDNCREGFGTYKWPNGDYYTGQFHWGKYRGYGYHVWASGSTYKGQYQNDEKHGFGTFTKHTGQVFTGKWESNVPRNCKFGLYYHHCKRCNLDVCDRCHVLNHSSCRTRQQWTSIENMQLDCKHISL